MKTQIKLLLLSTSLVSLSVFCTKNMQKIETPQDAEAFAGEVVIFETENPYFLLEAYKLSGGLLSGFVDPRCKRLSELYTTEVHNLCVIGCIGGADRLSFLFDRTLEEWPIHMRKANRDELREIYQAIKDRKAKPFLGLGGEAVIDRFVYALSENLLDNSSSQEPFPKRLKK